MRQFPRLDSSLAAALLTVAISFTTLLPSPVAAQRGGGSNSRPGSGDSTASLQVFSIRGRVVDSRSHAQLESVRVELRGYTGSTVGTALTRVGGDFEFQNLSPGSFELIAQQAGFHTATLRVDLTNMSILGVTVELESTSDPSSAIPGAPPVSARDLAIPRKAHEAMEKGLALQYEKSDYPGSIKQFERAMHAYPDYYEAETEVGIAYLRLKNNDSAEQALRKAVEISKEKYSDALFWLATLLNDTRRFADAEPFARKGVELDANSWETNAELARSLLGQNHPREAEENALAASKLQPDNALLYLILANIHSRLENVPALLEDLNNYIRLVPTGPMADQARAQRKQLQQGLLDAQNVLPPPALMAEFPELPSAAPTKFEDWLNFFKNRQAREYTCALAAGEYRCRGSARCRGSFVPAGRGAERSRSTGKGVDRKCGSIHGDGRNGFLGDRAGRSIEPGFEIHVQLSGGGWPGARRRFEV